ncbi:HalX domain-containing protein [Natronoarchaeum philippinense]|uniref:HalX domain-containing protein n=1 Tax=Natronoarchaeum philippinense TaxID=558529 RepID=A0A285N438_NATPI|nr:response regulator [Natronoarchaeum philippinense]SNZ04200.1 HalX domain-containing protein [Natronoarchaeum philippinense]
MDDHVGPEATILVVDDEERVTDLYATYLDELYSVRRAYSGAEALDAIDAQVDVVLLDRRMPELSGDEVLRQLREEGYDCRVVMVTAIEPDFDIVDMAFDEYLVKPATEEEVRDAVETQLLLDSYDTRLNEYFRLKAKLSALEDEKSYADLEADDRYEELTVLAESLREDLERMLSEYDELDFSASGFEDD